MSVRLRVAELRKTRDITQAALARRAGISVSLLSKIEIGDRALTPGVAAAVARALQISLGALYGEVEISLDQSRQLEDLRTAVRRYDVPDQAPVPEPAQLRVDVNRAITLREQADLAGLLRLLPGLLTRATTYAHAAASLEGRALLADVYSVTYYLAARHRRMDLVELALSAKPKPRGSNHCSEPPQPCNAPSSTAGTSRAGSLSWIGDRGR